MANDLVNTLCRLGFPSEIVSDFGMNFTSRLIKILCKACGIKCLTYTTYHPETNGFVERFNRTLGWMIKGYVAENQNDWDEQLQPLSLLRSTPGEFGIQPL